MPGCPRINHCPLFKNELRERLLLTEIIRLHFCRHRFTECARYFCYAQGLPPPVNLYPNEQSRVMAREGNPEKEAALMGRASV